VYWKWQMLAICLIMSMEKPVHCDGSRIGVPSASRTITKGSVATTVMRHGVLLPCSASQCAGSGTVNAAAAQAQTQAEARMARDPPNILARRTTQRLHSGHFHDLTVSPFLIISIS